MQPGACRLHDKFLQPTLEQWQPLCCERSVIYGVANVELLACNWQSDIHLSVAVCQPAIIHFPLCGHFLICQPEHRGSDVCSMHTHYVVPRLLVVVMFALAHEVQRTNAMCSARGLQACKGKPT
eukprot:365470-Chlamydomonas_euryale.AAC.5